MTVPTFKKGVIYHLVFHVLSNTVMVAPDDLFYPLRLIVEISVPFQFWLFM